MEHTTDAAGRTPRTPRAVDDERAPVAGRSAIVVGAGIVGVSIAWRLTRSGWDVTLVEAFSPGHARAASGGPSRLVRFASGADDEIAGSAVRSVALWHRIGEALGEDLFVRSGYLLMSSDASETFALDSVLQHERRGVAYESLDPSRAAALFPSLRTDDLTHFLYEPEAGFVLARPAVRRLVADAQERGMTVLGGVAAPAGDAVTVGDRRLEADAVVWAAGGWTPELFPQIVAGHRERHDLLQFGVDHSWRTPGVPAWTDADSMFDGMGDVDGGGMRLGGYFHEPADVDAPTWIASERQQAAARAVLGHRFPTLASAPLVGALACHSTEITEVFVEPLTTVGGARVWRHPAHSRVWVVGDGSASLFRHGPDIGWQLEGLIGDHV